MLQTPRPHGITQEDFIRIPFSYQAMIRTEIFWLCWSHDYVRQMLSPELLCELLTIFWHQRNALRVTETLYAVTTVMGYHPGLVVFPEVFMLEAKRYFQQIIAKPSEPQPAVNSVEPEASATPALVDSELELERELDPDYIKSILERGQQRKHYILSGQEERDLRAAYSSNVTTRSATNSNNSFAR